ncbi:MAG: hypothetical protein ACP5N2_04765 [Candidatus Nanoarchaeia archaeon]
MDETNKKSTEGLFTSLMTVAIVGATGIYLIHNQGQKQSEYESQLEKKTAQTEQLSPKNIILQDVNGDNLQDLIYKTGGIYLQQKNGKFVSYESVVKQEKANIDTKYKITQDSIMNQYAK